MLLKKTFFLIFVTANFIFAQDKFRFKAPRPLLNIAHSEYAMQPKWSPDGKQIAFTASSYQGLFVYTPSKHSLQKISAAPSAGFDFSWSPDSKTLAARVSRYEKGFRLNAIKIFNLQNNKTELLTKFRPGTMGTPRWASDNYQVYFSSKNKWQFVATKNEPLPVKNSAAYFAENSHIVITEGNSQDKIIRTIPGLDIINLVSAPDKSKFVFEAMNGNMYVIGADGSNLLNLGPGDGPAWSPNSKNIVYSITEDDGHEFTKSDLFIISADGRFKQNITESPELELHPDWSPDGKSIIYDDYRDGILYILFIKDKEQ